MDESIRRDAVSALERAREVKGIGEADLFGDLFHHETIVEESCAAWFILRRIKNWCAPTRANRRKSRKT